MPFFPHTIICSISHFEADFRIIFAFVFDLLNVPFRSFHLLAQSSTLRNSHASHALKLVFSTAAAAGIDKEQSKLPTQGKCSFPGVVHNIFKSATDTICSH